MTPRLIRMLVEYDGAHLSGWQRQDNLATVQGAMEDALCLITGQPKAVLDVRSAGRTDAGVHALGQVVTFHTQSQMEARRFAPALNHHLPTSIRVHLAEEAQEGFSARHDAVRKSYRYTIYTGAHPSALLAHRAWHVRRRLDHSTMQGAACCLEGAHDFESFRHAHCDAPHARRVLHQVQVQPCQPFGAGRVLHITLVGDAFCRHMCRIIAGTLMEVGAGLRAADDMPTVLAAKDRTKAGVTAPGCGLTLMQVVYPPQLGVLQTS